MSEKKFCLIQNMDRKQTLMFDVFPDDLFTEFRAFVRSDNFKFPVVKNCHKYVKDVLHNSGA